MTLLTTVLFVFTTPPAFANQMSNQELALAFGSQIKPQQVAVLSQQEMDETEGALGWGGALVGVGSYGGSVAYRSWDSTSLGNTFNNFANNWNTTDALWAAASGLVGGTLSSTLFKDLGYSTFGSQLTAPLLVQKTVRGSGAGLGFSTFGVHGYPTTNFQNQAINNYVNRYSSTSCFSCYGSRW